MPPLPSLVSSLRHLTILGALDIDKRSELNDLLSLKVKTDTTLINELGTLLSKLPLSPKFSKMLVVSTKYNVLRYVIMVVACLSVPELFKEIPQVEIDLPEADEMDEDLTTAFDRQKIEKKKKRLLKEAAHARMKLLREKRATWQNEASDCILYANLLVDYFNYIKETSEPTSSFAQVENRIEEFCRVNNLQTKAIKEVHYLCIQLHKMAKEIVTSALSEEFDFKSPNLLLERPSKQEVTVI